MTPRTVRKAERAVHLAWAVLLALYVYGLLPSWGEPAVRWLVVPGIAASGFAMWFAAPLRKLVRSMRGRVPGKRVGRNPSMLASAASHSVPSRSDKRRLPGRRRPMRVSPPRFPA